jgi:hypothetical protein
VGVEQDRDAAAAQLLQQVAHDPPAGGVQRAGGLVEQQQPGTADQRLRDAQALLHALRHRLHTPGRRVAEAHELEQLGALGRPALRAGQALVQDQQLVGRRPAGEAEELGQIAERAPRRRRARGRAADAHAAAGRSHQPAGALDQRRLPGAVGTEQSDELALAHDEIDAAEGVGGAVALGEG